MVTTERACAPYKEREFFAWIRRARTDPKTCSPIPGQRL